MLQDYLSWKLLGKKSSFTHLFAIGTFIGVNPSRGNFEEALVRYLDVQFIFNPALAFLLSCLFQVINREENHYIFLITRCEFMLGLFNFTCLPLCYHVPKIPPKRFTLFHNYIHQMLVLAYCFSFPTYNIQFSPLWIRVKGKFAFNGFFG